MTNGDYQSLLDFWFSEETKAKWFNSTPEFDQALTDQYLSVWQAAKNGQLKHWQSSAAGSLALIIILDQLPLNMFRGQPQSFATEAMSRDVAAHAIQQGHDQQLTDLQKAFIYLPYMHSEDMADQERSVELFENAGLTDNLKWAKHHRDIVKRFGRFPHRNAVLSRESSQEEIDYLNSKESFKG